MKNVPLQVVVVELENGRRGVFFGPPVIGDEENDGVCHVENIWFSNINDLPDDASLSQLSRVALERFADQGRHWH